MNNAEGIIVSPSRLASHPDYQAAKQRFEDAVMAANMVRATLSDMDLIAAKRHDEWDEVIRQLKGQ